jgi:hypothetical protein
MKSDRDVRPFLILIASLLATVLLYDHIAPGWVPLALIGFVVGVSFSQVTRG